ncbi:SpoIIE family protein phosphatase [Xanthomonas hortorum]|nr:SpoIIE family protein phosphatase [Xanthomonas hortorum]MCE4353717.1 SpoIIE family protein phosphatase [Xanthomonas hortorum pv. pelargonii]MCM5524890.1 SpoIIE family protein phosphatase [Xanthomonas hortorum pv. pelargonii]MCM5537510.1 SpoIIE family protein phosphatase [Xanthomonas hortorum pv. pelargonii]MCM5541678.1 SpoIIE family protein phosphatase [Xanthomonas hortorum pv. pelargonii]MCM5545018.1 SpoIIE family protein phosphatase [Xanthomonas hortorum pv. pelargonii]
MRVLLAATAVLVLLLAVLGTVFYLGARAELVEAARTEVDGLTEQTARSLAAMLDSVQVSGRTLAASSGAVGLQPFNLRALLLATLSGDPDIGAARLIIEPRTQKAGDTGFVWYVHREGTRVLEKSVQELGDDYRAMPWYLRTQREGRAWWSEPYINTNGGGELYTSYNLPLRRPGDAVDAAPVGMVSVDLPLQHLRAIIDQLPHDISIRPMLLSPEGMVMFSPDPALNLHDTLATYVARSRPDLAPLQRAVAAGQPISFSHTAPDGERFLTHSAAVGRSGWTFVLSASENYVLAGLNWLAAWVALAALLGAAVWWWLMGLITRTLTRPIEELTDTAEHFRRGEFEYPLRHIERDDEVGVMARAFDSARGAIRDHIAQIGEMTSARERMYSELQIAREIQQAMLPSGRTFDRANSHLETCAWLEPAKAVGGDFYHFIETEPGLLWFVVGDVSDKGVPAALFMARAVSVLEIAARRHTRPDAILIAASTRLAENNEPCMFATVLCGVINVVSGEYWLASAGHEPPLLIDLDGTVRPLPLETGAPLGIEPQLAYPVLQGRMSAGQTLLGYTDGVTEAMDEHGASYGLERLLAALHPRRSAAAQCKAVIDDIAGFTGQADAYDDITLLAIRLRQEHAEPNAAGEATTP